MAAAPPVVAVEIKDPTKEGWLLKKSRYMGSWRKRWGVLQGSQLYTFKDERVYEAPTEVLDLKIFSSVKSSEETTRKAHSFDVYSLTLRFSMAALTESDKEDWIRHIGKAIVLSNTTSIMQKDYEYGHDSDSAGDEEEEEADE